MAVNSSLISTDMKWAYILDIALLDEDLKQYIFRIVSRKEKYCLTSCYLEFPVQQKAGISKRLLATG